MLWRWVEYDIVQWPNPLQQIFPKGLPNEKLATIMSNEIVHIQLDALNGVTCKVSAPRQVCSAPSVRLSEQCQNNVRFVGLSKQLIKRLFWPTVLTQNGGHLAGVRTSRILGSRGQMAWDKWYGSSPALNQRKQLGDFQKKQTAQAQARSP